MNLRELALKEFAEDEALKAAESQKRMESVERLARSRFEDIFQVAPDRVEPINEKTVDVWHGDIHLRYNDRSFCLVAPCEKCGEMLVYNNYVIGSLLALGYALHSFVPKNSHFCPSDRTSGEPTTTDKPTSLVAILEKIAGELRRMNDAHEQANFFGA